MRGERLGGLTVLIVEDEWLVRMEIADAFADEGCIVRESGSAEDAIAMLEQEVPDLLVTDIRLNGAMTGWELATRARQFDPSLAVIYLSANPPSPQSQVSGGRFIDKPALMEKLVSVAVELVV